VYYATKSPRSKKKKGSQMSKFAASTPENISDDISGYAELPYPSYTFPQTSPDRLSTMAILHGLNPPDPANCRYLELGCGDGTNVAAMASMFPGSKFTGIDLSQTHIERAIKISEHLGLENISFLAKDILEIDLENFGRFDYIVAHGLFSWIPDNVRAKVLESMQACLTPEGIAYISYNVLPGCYLRKIGWDLMRLRASKIDNIDEKISEALEIVPFIGAESEANTIASAVYKKLAADNKDKNAESLYHDDLADINKPFYFLDFVALIGEFGLKFVCEAETDVVSKTAKLKLDKITADPLEREQYLDFIDLAQFRMSLICGEGLEIKTSPTASEIERLHAQSSLVAATDQKSIFSTDPVSFTAADGRKIAVNHPLTKSALAALGSIKPDTIRTDELIAQAEESLRANGVVIASNDKAQTLQFLLSLFVAGFVKLFTAKPAFAVEPDEKPKVHDFARWQAANHCECATTLLGENIGISSDLIRNTLTLLDGTRKRDALARDLLVKLNVPEEGIAEAEAHLPAVIDANISKFAELGLFVK
jgi:SAM-dependent methyltransferase/methyltransferase-like protein